MPPSRSAACISGEIGTPHDTMTALPLVRAKSISA
jgi:hypothetical protein